MRATFRILQKLFYRQTRRFHLRLPCTRAQAFLSRQGHRHRRAEFLKHPQSSSNLKDLLSSAATAPHCGSVCMQKIYPARPRYFRAKPRELFRRIVLQSQIVPTPSPNLQNSAPFAHIRPNCRRQRNQATFQSTPQPLRRRFLCIYRGENLIFFPSN